jgi:small ligand-binding sensory domain FIST
MLSRMIRPIGMKIVGTAVNGIRRAAIGGQLCRPFGSVSEIDKGNPEV